MIGIERERNCLVGVSEFYDLPISSLCQKVSVYFKSCISDVLGPKPLLQLKATVRDTVSTP